MNIRQFWDRFSQPQACLEEVVKRKGLSCCGPFWYRKSRPVVICSKCKKRFYPLTGTMFENSKISLPLWFYALFLVSHSKHGLPANELKRQLGVSYPTAFAMMKKIRSLMVVKPLFKGRVEADETYIGGDGKNRAKKWYGSEVPKQPLFGVTDGVKVKAFPIKGIGKWHLLKAIREYVVPGSTVMTDGYDGYKQLPKFGYPHHFVEHKFQFVKNPSPQVNVHTQHIENFWSQLKRGLTGVYRSVSLKYLASYADEFAFYYNHRHEDIFGLLFYKSLRPGLKVEKNSSI